MYQIPNYDSEEQQASRELAWQEATRKYRNRYLIPLLICIVLGLIGLVSIGILSRRLDSLSLALDEPPLIWYVWLVFIGLVIGTVLTFIKLLNFQHSSEGQLFNGRIQRIKPLYLRLAELEALATARIPTWQTEPDIEAIMAIKDEMATIKSEIWEEERHLGHSFQKADGTVRERYKRDLQNENFEILVAHPRHEDNFLDYFLDYYLDELITDETSV